MMKLWMKNAGVMVVAMGLMACGDDNGYAPVSTDLNLPLSVKSVDSADGDTDETSVIAIRESKGLSLNRGTYQVTAGPIVDLGRQLFILEMVEGLHNCAGDIRPGADLGDELEIEVREDDCSVQFVLRDETDVVVEADDWDLDLQ